MCLCQEGYFPFTEVVSASKTPVTEGEEFWKAVVQSKKEKSEVTTFGLQAHRSVRQWRRSLLWTVRAAEAHRGKPRMVADERHAELS